MLIENAPPPGWYPDPEGGSRLRWWEGTDWSDRFRAPPTQSEFDRKTLVAATHQRDEVIDLDYSSRPQMGSLNRQDSEAIIQQVRMAAREEAERAAAMFGVQAKSAARNLQPLISEYTSRITRWFRIASVIAVVLLIGWVAFQLFAQVSMCEWIGDRIDNLTDNNGVLVGGIRLE